MKIDDFIGKVIVESKTQKRFLIHEISSPIIEIVEEFFYDGEGPSTIYQCHIKDGNPFVEGKYVFEDTSLLEEFKEAYEAHRQSDEGYWEEYCYWSKRI